MPSSFCLAYFLPGLALNQGPLDIHLQSSWDYRLKPPRPAQELAKVLGRSILALATQKGPAGLGVWLKW
jgi:hypothetical protein